MTEYIRLIIHSSTLSCLVQRRLGSRGDVLSIELTFDALKTLMNFKLTLTLDKMGPNLANISII
jgi:hypothetical protein